MHKYPSIYKKGYLDVLQQNGYLYKMEGQKNNPLHGIRLDTILEQLVGVYGWEELGNKIQIRCFTDNPSIKSSLTFLRKTPWAREKVERLYVRMTQKKNNNS